MERLGPRQTKVMFVEIWVRNGVAVMGFEGFRVWGLGLRVLRFGVKGVRVSRFRLSGS